jgi:hypothetical protein
MRASIPSSCQKQDQPENSTDLDSLTRRDATCGKNWYAFLIFILCRDCGMPNDGSQEARAMDLMMEGKSAMVSGSRGIGFQNARDLALESCNVLLSGRHREDVDAAEKELKASGAAAPCSMSLEALRYSE